MRFFSYVLTLLLLFGLAGCAIDQTRGVMPSLAPVSSNNIRKYKTHFFTRSFDPCLDCHVVYTFGSSLSLTDLADNLKCQTTDITALNPWLQHLRIKDGQIIHLPACCQMQAPTYFTAVPLVAAVPSGHPRFSRLSVKLNNNFCSAEIVGNPYRPVFMPIICPTKTTPLSFKTYKDGGIVIYVSPSSFVTASAAGEVVFAGKLLKKYGNIIVVKHTYDYMTVYEHTGPQFVHQGDFVQVGQRLAEPLCTRQRCRFVFAVRFYGHVLPMRLSILPDKVNLKIGDLFVESFYYDSTTQSSLLSKYSFFMSPVYRKPPFAEHPGVVKTKHKKHQLPHRRKKLVKSAKHAHVQAAKVTHKSRVHHKKVRHHRRHHKTHHRRHQQSMATR